MFASPDYFLTEALTGMMHKNVVGFAAAALVIGLGMVPALVLAEENPCG